MKYIFLSAPTGAPQSVNVTVTSSTTLELKWAPPLKAETNGVIREYSIRYRQVECTTNGTNLTAWTTSTVNGSKTSTELKNLAKWSCYEVQIRAVTIKSGVWSDSKQSRTREDGKRVKISI